MLDILIYLGLIVVAFWLGWHARMILLLSRMAQDPDHFMGLLTQIKAINQEEGSEQSTELTIEEVNGQFYAYVKQSNQFVAQAQNLNDLLELVNKQYPAVKYGKINSNNSAKEVVQQ